MEDIKQDTLNKYYLKYMEAPERSAQRKEIVSECAEALKMSNDKVRKKFNNINQSRKSEETIKVKDNETIKVEAALKSYPNKKIINGYTYYKNKIVIESKSVYYYCKCNCSAIFSLCDDGVECKLKGEHKASCPITFLESQEEKKNEVTVHNKMIEICQKNISFKDAYAELYKWFNIEVAGKSNNPAIWKLFDEGKIRSLYQLQRKLDRPESDKNLTSLYSVFQPIVSIIPHVLAFQNKNMYERMKNIDILLVDGTFESAPFPFYQLVNFMGMCKGGTRFINIFHILIEGKSENDYFNAFTFCSFYLKQMNPSLIITDYEIGLVNALKTIFPDNIDKYGKSKRYINCYFHYTQLLRKHFISCYGKRKEKSIKHAIYKMAMHVPFVSEETRKEFLFFISNNCGDGKAFVDYYLNRWGSMDNSYWSTINNEYHTITQCALEGFHHVLNGSFKQKPSLEELAKTLYLIDERILNFEDASAYLDKNFKSKAKNNGEHISSFMMARNEYLECINK